MPEDDFRKYEGSQLKPDKVNCLMQRLHDAGCSRFKKSTQERLFEKGREILENEIDIVNFLQKFRELTNIVNLKIKLTHDEKRFVTNKSFTKLQLSDDHEESSTDGEIRNQTAKNDL